MQSDGAHSEGSPVDVHVGAKVREARSKLGMSAANLAQAIGVSENDMEDFEKGRQRIGSSLLCDLCRALGRQVSYFFSGYAAPSGTPSDTEDTDLTIRITKLLTAFLDLSPEKQEEAYSAIRAMGTPDDGAD